MGIEETNIMKRVMKAASKLNCRLWRNNVGEGWVSNKSTLLNKGQVYIAKGGERVIFAPRWIKFGLDVGSHDSVGFVRVKITPDMVGRDVAIFLGVEEKTPVGKESPAQLNFHRVVKEWGGISIVARSEEDFTVSLADALKFGQ